MRINNDISTYKAPFTIVLFDAWDAYYYADLIDDMYEIDKLENLEVAKALAIALFISKNYKWESFKEMIDKDGGYDVRIYDGNFSCIFAAHERFKDKWIGE